MEVNHYVWLRNNFEQFCKNSGFKYTYGAISAHGDKLSSLQYECEKQNIPFHKWSAIGLSLFLLYLNTNKDFDTFEENCIKFYNEHPEWFENCTIKERDYEKAYKRRNQN